MSEMNVGAELNKLQRISEQAALVIALHRESLNDPDFDVFAIIKQIKQEILELLAPIDFYVVYKELKVYQGGLKEEAIGYYLGQKEAEYASEVHKENEGYETYDYFAIQETLE